MSTMRWQIGIAALAAALSFSGCVRTPPEQRLRDTVAALQAAIEARDVGGMKEILAEDFVGTDGLDREGTGRLAQVMFLRHRDVGVSLGPLEVELHERHATVRFNAALTGGSGAPLPDTARLYDVETGWRLEGNQWRLTSASWTPRL
ncbi:MAG: nuclear transport factor 2 family protein [Luteimonas sp.]